MTSCGPLNPNDPRFLTALVAATNAGGDMKPYLNGNVFCLGNGPVNNLPGTSVCYTPQTANAALMAHGEALVCKDTQSGFTCFYGPFEKATDACKTATSRNGPLTAL